MEIMYELAPTKNFLEQAEETKDMVDGWNITDSAVGEPAPSGTAVSCVLKERYPEKITIPLFIMHYKGPVEASGLALAADAMNLDGIIISMGDIPNYGEPIKMLGSSSEARDFLREEVGIEELKLGSLLTANRSMEDITSRINEDWDFFFFLRLEDKTFDKLKKAAEKCKSQNKPIYPYFLVETPRNEEMIDMIGWPPTTTMDKVEEFASRLEGTVDGIIATCAGDHKGIKELLERLQKFRD